MPTYKTRRVLRDLESKSEEGATMKHYYPAIFSPKGNGLEGYELEFPDVPGCLTMGDDLDECHWMAQDALGLMLNDVDEKNYPVLSNVRDVDLSDSPEGSFVSLVCFDKEKYDADSKNPIRAMGKHRGLNAAQTAKLLGAPYRKVKRWFKGTTRPSPWIDRLIVEKIYNSV